MMALTKCRECGHEVSTSAKNCPNCGARVPDTTKGMFYLAVLVVLAGSWLISLIPSRDIGHLVQPATATAPALPAAASSPPASAVAEAPPPKPPLSAASAVAEGDALVKRSNAADARYRAAQRTGKQADLVPGDLIRKDEWADARAHLQAITKEQPEYARAQSVLKAMATVDKRNADFMAALEAKAAAEQRKRFAQEFEQGLVDKVRMDADVSALGPQNTTLRIKYALANKVMANDMSKSGIIQKAQSLGFKSVQLTDGYDSTWTWKLD